LLVAAVKLGTVCGYSSIGTFDELWAFTSELVSASLDVFAVLQTPFDVDLFTAGEKARFPGEFFRE
jgi:hypothetical protein